MEVREARRKKSHVRPLVVILSSVLTSSLVVASKIVESRLFHRSSEGQALALRSYREAAASFRLDLAYPSTLVDKPLLALDSDMVHLGQLIVRGGSGPRCQQWSTTSRQVLRRGACRRLQQRPGVLCKLRGTKALKLVSTLRDHCSTHHLVSTLSTHHFVLCVQ